MANFRAIAGVSATLDQERRDRLGALADVMLPETLTMPAATQAGAIEAHLDQVLMARPDLADDLHRAVDGLDPRGFDLAALEQLLATDEDAYVALTTVVAATYYQSPIVRERIGYPGQVAKTYDPYAYVQWVDEGLLDPVVERGPIWRDPGGER